VDYNADVIMTFESEQQLREFQARYGERDVAEKIGESTRKFIGEEKLMVLGVEKPRVTCA
jgi:hypothetical protein